MDLVQEYVKMRSLGNSKKTITATPRQLESLIRIAESLAKMRLSEWVEKKDLDEAVRLIKQALQQSATDPTTGEINMDIINTGQTKTSGERLKMICDFTKKLQHDFRDKVSSSGLKYGNLLDFLNMKAKNGEIGDKGNVIQETEFRDALRVLEEENVISIFGNSRAPTIRFNNFE
jgi:DNA replication licensing factor MCM4